MLKQIQDSLIKTKDFLLKTRWGWLVSGLILLILLFTIIAVISSGPEPELPKVLSVTPANNETEVPVNTQVAIQFEKPAPQAVTLVTKPLVEFELIKSPLPNKLIFKPKRNLNFDTTYQLKARIEGKDLFSFSFTTLSAVEKLKADAPFKLENFSVSYDKKHDKFFVFINKGDFDEGQKASLSWFAEQGVENPQALPISFFPPPGSLRRFIEATSGSQP